MIYFDDLVDYFIKNPPIEISNELKDKYRKLVYEVGDNTLLEYSEYNPEIKEKEKIFSGSNDYMLINIYEEIDENFMKFIIFDTKDNVLRWINRNAIIEDYMIKDDFAIKSGSFLNIISNTELLYLAKEYFEPKIKKILYNNKDIKVKPNVTYYILYEAYLSPENVSKNDLNDLRNLMHINLLIELYNSPIFASEGGIKSVSLSGLSVTFNIPSKDGLDRTLQLMKERVINALHPIDEIASF